MYPNLDAEQARHKMTDAAVAEKLGMKRAAYSRRKQTGRFLASECLILCKLFNCSFNYLFSPDAA